MRQENLYENRARITWAVGETRTGDRRLKKAREIALFSLQLGSAAIAANAEQW